MDESRLSISTSPNDQMSDITCECPPCSHSVWCSCVPKQGEWACSLVHASIQEEKIQEKQHQNGCEHGAKHVLQAQLSTEGHAGDCLILVFSPPFFRQRSAFTSYVNKLAFWQQKHCKTTYTGSLIRQQCKECSCQAEKVKTWRLFL